MPEPSLEIALFNVGGHTLEDESTEDGQMWHGLFARLTKIPGFIRAAWGRRVDERSWNLFLVDWESYEHHEKFMNEKGDFTPPLMGILTGDFDMYHITPNTSSREFMNAPLTTLTFFLQPIDGKFATPLEQLLSGIEAADGCRGLTWAVARRPPRRDPSKFLRDGTGVVLIMGWDSPEQLETALESEAVSRNWKMVEGVVGRIVHYAFTLRVTERSQYEHSWRRL